MTKEEVEALGYTHVVYINEMYCGLYRFIFTIGLVTGINEDGYRSRYCYSSYKDAVDAITVWDGKEDPSGNWIKQKGFEGDRPNPNYYQDYPINIVFEITNEQL